VCGHAGEYSRAAGNGVLAAGLGRCPRPVCPPPRPHGEPAAVAGLSDAPGGLREMCAKVSPERMRWVPGPRSYEVPLRRRVAECSEPPPYVGGAWSVEAEGPPTGERQGPRRPGEETVVAAAELGVGGDCTEAAWKGPIRSGMVPAVRSPARRCRSWRTGGETNRVADRRDNAPAATLDVIPPRSLRHGSANVRRAYGNWKSRTSSGWERACTPTRSADPAVRYSKCKNASGHGVVIDAMDPA